MKLRKLLIVLTFVTTPTLAQLPITVMTYNVFGCKGADGVADDEDIPRLGRVITAQSPDLLGIQEVREVHATELGTLAKLDNIEWAAPGKVGEALLSTFTIKNVKEILLPPEESRMLIFSEVEVTGSTGATETIVFITTHFDFNDDAAKLASAKIVDSVFNANYDNNQPAIFTGDLNSRKGSDPINYLDQSWEIENFSFRIDWIMYRPAERWKVLNVTEIDTGEAQQASDHKPVVMKLEYQFQTDINITSYNADKGVAKFKLINRPENNLVKFQFSGNTIFPASIRIVNTFGETIKILPVDNELGNIVWGYSNNVPSGMYHCFLVAGKVREVQPLMVIK